MTVVANPFAAAADLLDPPEVDVFGALGYHPEPAQQRFHDATEYDVGYGGRAGAGKSMALLMDGIRACVRYPGLKGVIFRRTYDELQESILDKIIERLEVLEECYRVRLVGLNGRPVLTFANGSEIRMRHAETLPDATRRQGGGYQWVGVDERQLVHPSVVEYLMTRIRTANTGVPVIGIRSTFNPGEIGHGYLRDRYVDATNHGAHPYAITHNSDGQEIVPPVTVRFIPGEKSAHMGPGYWSTLLADPDPVRRRQLLDGDWDVGSGLLFSETWRRHIHVIEPEQLPIPTGQGISRGIGIDYGTANPFCALWGAVLADGLVVIYRELYQRGLTPTQQARLILASEMPDEHGHRRQVPAWLDPSCWIAYPDSPRPPAGVAPLKSIAADFVAAGVPVMKAQNDRVGGARLVHDHLRLREDGRPRLLIYSTCPNLIRQLGSIPRSKTNPEDAQKNDDDHAYDTLKYLLYGLVGKRNTTGSHRPSSLDRPVTAGLMSRGF